MTVGSIAATGLTTGDIIVKIGDTDTSSLTFAQAQEVVKNAENLLQLSIIKYVRAAHVQPTFLTQIHRSHRIYIGL